MISEPFSWEGEDPCGRLVKFSATIIRAGIVETLKHDRLIYEGLQRGRPTKENPSPLIDHDEQTARVVLYPTCIASSRDVRLEVDGQIFSGEIPFESFLDLPPDLIDSWMGAGLRMNSRWQSSRKTEEADDEKKVMPSIDDSSISTHRPVTTIDPKKTRPSQKSSI